MGMNVHAFEASFYDHEKPGYHAIEKDGVEYLKITKLEIIKRVLHCDFMILTPPLSNDEIEALVFVALLEEYCDGSYDEDADYIKFRNNDTLEEWTIVNIGYFHCRYCPESLSATMDSAECRECQEYYSAR